MRDSLPSIWSSLLGALSADERIAGIWLGGSYARGDADAYSDIDLAVAAPSDWTPTALGDLWVAYQSNRLGGAPFFHGILADGTILDLLVTESGPDGYLAIDPVVPQAANPAEPEVPGLLIDFWINTHKHRKVIARGLEAMTVFGLGHERTMLLRLWVWRDTGNDPGPSAGTIHGMTPLIRRHVFGKRRALLGRACADEAEVRATIQAHREEVSRAGREIAADYGVPYPSRLESLVLSFDI